MQIHLRVDGSSPVFCKAGAVPFAVRERYDAALDKLEREGIIRKVEHAQCPHLLYLLWNQMDLREFAEITPAQSMPTQNVNTTRNLLLTSYDKNLQGENSLLS